MTQVWNITREPLRGKSLGRALLADECRQISLVGEVIDLGSKDGAGAQHRYMDTRRAKMTFSDVNPQSDHVIKIDLEGDQPMSLKSFDGALIIYVLEHVFDYAKALRTAFGLLEPGGKIIGAVPQLERCHPDPDDYFRFTCSGLTGSLEKAGFTDVRVIPLGIGPATAAAHLLAPVLKFRILRTMISVPAVLSGLLLRLVSGKNLAAIYAIGFLFEAAKPTGELNAAG